VDWTIYWDPMFEASLGRLGLTLEIFERLGQFAVDFVLHRDPFEARSTFSLAGTDHRYMWTYHRSPDLPSMLVAYTVDPLARSVTLVGVEGVWDADLAADLSS
jgi:hypothetical protein